MTNKEKLSQVRNLLKPSQLNQAERSGESVALELLADVVESHESGKSAPAPKVAKPKAAKPAKDNGK